MLMAPEETSLVIVFLTVVAFLIDGPIGWVRGWNDMRDEKYDKVNAIR